MVDINGIVQTAQMITPTILIDEKRILEEAHAFLSRPAKVSSCSHVTKSIGIGLLLCQMQEKGHWLMQ